MDCSQRKKPVAVPRNAGLGKQGDIDHGQRHHEQVAGEGSPGDGGPAGHPLPPTEYTYRGEDNGMVHEGDKPLQWDKSASSSMYTVE